MHHVTKAVAVSHTVRWSNESDNRCWMTFDLTELLHPVAVCYHPGTDRGVSPGERSHVPAALNALDPLLSSSLLINLNVFIVANQK